MYQKPDFIKVSVKANDVFAAYGATGGPEEEYTTATVPCTPSDPQYEHTTFTGWGWGIQCYQHFNP